MTLYYWIQGLLVGIAIAAPVGPIGVLCIRQTLLLGKRYGFVCGLGAASADAVYGFIAGAGLTVITHFLISNQLCLQIVGGLFLCYLGIQTFYSLPVKKQLDTHNSLLTNFLTTFLLTLTNPMTILSFLSIFASFTLASSTTNALHMVFMVMGVFCGSAVWWWVLSVIVSLFREKVDIRTFRWINRTSGLLILIFGLVALFKGLSH